MHKAFFLLLLLTRAYIPEDVKAVIEGTDFSSNIYGYIPFTNIDIYQFFLENFEFELTNTLLEPIGIKYDSTVANLASVILFTILMVFLSISIYLFRLLFMRLRERERWKWLVKTWYWIFDKLYIMLIFGYFIRNVLEISQYSLIASIDEIYNHNTSSIYRTSSFIFALIVILIFFLLMSFILYLIFSSYRLSEEKHNKLGEFFFRGLRQDKKYKFYVIALLLRRFAFVMLLITCQSLLSRFLIIILVVIQIIYVVYIIYTRPYCEVKGNLIEILNELYFSFLLSILIAFNSENNWNTFKTDTYMWLLTSNTFIVFLITCGKKLQIIYSLLYKREH